MLFLSKFGLEFQESAEAAAQFPIFPDLIRKLILDAASLFEGLGDLFFDLSDITVDLPIHPDLRAAHLVLGHGQVEVAGRLLLRKVPFFSFCSRSLIFSSRNLIFAWRTM
jgi:hypothetical protein